MNNLNWNLERFRTRDRLLEYGYCLCPPIPHHDGWEDISLNKLNHQLYLLALQNGFVGTEDEFNNMFFSYINNKDVIFALYQDFPEEGATDKLYFDLDEKILYYYSEPLHKYIPANALLIEHTLLQGGEA